MAVIGVRRWAVMRAGITGPATTAGEISSMFFNELLARNGPTPFISTRSVSASSTSDFRSLSMPHFYIRASAQMPVSPAFMPFQNAPHATSRRHDIYSPISMSFMKRFPGKPSFFNARHARRCQLRAARDCPPQAMSPLFDASRWASARMTGSVSFKRDDASH